MICGAETALVVVDVQNDFCAGPVEEVTTNVSRAVEAARETGIEVLFVRFLGDLQFQGAAQRRRDAVLGKKPKCLSGTWGARFHKIAPVPGERVFTKLACFDAFLSAGFEDHLVANGLGHLVFAGLYCDVCVDSTARTAFQKGAHITVLADCTASLHLAHQDILRFMRSAYGARISMHDRVAEWSCAPGGGERTWAATPGSRRASG